jgi:release factor glutamine methyltransferase
MNVRQAIAEAAALLPADNARRDAEMLLMHLLQRDRAWVLAHPEQPLDAETLDALRVLTRRRAEHEPMQYITGRQEFFGLGLRVTPNTLIPRPETELLVEAVLHWANELPASCGELRIVDVGTGTGAIAIALAAHLPNVRVSALDISTAALAIAQENALAHDVADRMIFRQSDLLGALDGEVRDFDAIVSNPPYIPLSDAASLAPEVRDHEPHMALFAGSTGLDIYQRLIPQAHAYLRPGGLLAMEFGFGQRESLRTLLTTTPRAFADIRFIDDYAGIPRIALATRL